MSRRQKHSDKGPQGGWMILLLLGLALAALILMGIGLLLSGGGGVR